MVDLAMTSCPVGWPCEPDRPSADPGPPDPGPPGSGPTVSPPGPFVPVIVELPAVPGTVPPPITAEPDAPDGEPPVSGGPPAPPVGCAPELGLGVIRVRMAPIGPAAVTPEAVAIDVVPCGAPTYAWWFAGPWVMVADDDGPFVPLYRADPSDSFAAIATHNLMLLERDGALLDPDQPDTPPPPSPPPVVETADESRSREPVRSSLHSDSIALPEPGGP